MSVLVFCSFILDMESDAAHASCAETAGQESSIRQSVYTADRTLTPVWQVEVSEMHWKALLKLEGKLQMNPPQKLYPARPVVELLMKEEEGKMPKSDMRLRFPSVSLI